MSIQAQRRLLQIVAAGFLVASVIVLWFGFSKPNVRAVDSKPIPVAKNKPQDSVETANLDSLLAASSMPLQRPLYDPPKPAPVVKPQPKVVKRAPKVITAVPKPEPKIVLQLLGTVVEAGRSIAIVADASGSIDQKPIGETLELQPAGLLLEEIQTGKVVVSHEGKRLTFSITSSSTESSGDRKVKKTRANGKPRKRDR